MRKTCIKIPFRGIFMHAPGVKKEAARMGGLLSRVDVGISS